MLHSVRYWVAFKGGRMLLRKEQWRAAASLLSRATKLAPHHWESHNNLAIALLKLGRWEEAAGMAQRAISLNPTAADSHDFFGIALLQMERWDEAVAAYRRAIKVDPARYDSYDRLGMAMSRLERWDEVIDTYEAALKLDAGRHAAHLRMGVALQRLLRWDAAAAAFRRAIALAEDDPGAAADYLTGLQLNLASVEAQLAASKGGGAAAVALTLHPGTEAHITRGVELLVLKRWSEAAVELAKGSALTPGLGALHFLRVDPLIRLGRFEEAVAAHHQAAASGGDMPGLPGQSAAARFAQRQAAFWSAGNLGAQVFAVERWLEQLSIVLDQTEVKPGPRLLFVLDNDFGELTTVKYFVLGQELVGRSTLLLPERLYMFNVDAIPGRTHRYASVDDILKVLERERPEIVFLCSGYLLCEHLGFTLDDLARLVDQLRERGCRVVTADPYMGMLSQRDPRSLISIDIPTAYSNFPVEQLANAKRAAEERMWAGFTKSEQILRDTYHLYPSYCGVAGEAAETDARNVAFFNARLVQPTLTTREEAAKPHWMFILGGPDCDIQALFEGDAFVDIMASKLLETRAAGRHPILIAPNEFIDKLMPRMPTAEGIDILSYIPFTRFMSLLLSAEHVFYWNAVSHSLLMRLFNGLPIVQFDRGHLLRIAPAIHDRIVEWYYQGWEPPIRDHREPLTLETVESWAADYRQQAARLVERFRQAPSPEEMLADLMRRPMTPGLKANVGSSDRRERVTGGEAA
jgi:Tfp pilus assembly protein PilF